MGLILYPWSLAVSSVQPVTVAGGPTLPSGGRRRWLSLWAPSFPFPPSHAGLDIFPQWGLIDGPTMQHNDRHLLHFLLPALALPPFPLPRHLVASSSPKSWGRFGRTRPRLATPLFSSGTGHIGNSPTPRQSCPTLCFIDKNHLAPCCSRKATPPSSQGGAIGDLTSKDSANMAVTYRPRGKKRTAILLRWLHPSC